MSRIRQVSRVVAAAVGAVTLVVGVGACSDDSDGNEAAEPSGVDAPPAEDGESVDPASVECADLFGVDEVSEAIGSEVLEPSLETSGLVQCVWEDRAHSETNGLEGNAVVVNIVTTYPEETLDVALGSVEEGEGETVITQEELGDLGDRAVMVTTTGFAGTEAVGVDLHVLAGDVYYSVLAFRNLDTDPAQTQEAAKTVAYDLASRL